MQISKSFPVFCAAAVCASLISARAADDNAAQAAARAALFSKMGDLQTADSTPKTNAVIVTADSAKAEAPTPAPAPAPAPVAATPVAPPTESQPMAAAPAAAPMTSSNGDNAAQAAARQALMEQSAQTTSQPVTVITAPAPAKSPVVAPQPMTPAVAPAPAQPAVTAPALPIAMTKEEKLQELLVKYKADQITPAEYHTQRAAIISGQ